MKDRLVIGVIGVPTYDDENDPVIAIYNEVKNLVVRKKAIPFLISPFLELDHYGTRLRHIPELTYEEKEYYDDITDNLDGLIIPGGYKFYEFEKHVVGRAMKQDMPVLGICKGMQLLSIMDNDKYCLTKNDTEINHKPEKTMYAHGLNIVEETLLSSIINEKQTRVNSKHTLHIDGVNKLKVSAVAEDGIIEAIESPEHTFVLGVQWHPEAMLDYDVHTNGIADRFIGECSKFKQKVKRM